MLFFFLIYFFFSPGFVVHKLRNGTQYSNQVDAYPSLPTYPPSPPPSAPVTIGQSFPV